MDDPKYEFVCGQVYDDLAKDVQKKLNEGWKIHGSPFTYIAPNGATITAQVIVSGDVYLKGGISDLYLGEKCGNN